MLLIINNYSGLNDNYEDMEEKLLNLMRDGTKYGIFFCMTVNGTSGIRYRVSQNFAQVYTMHQNDTTDYAVIVGNTEGILPTNYKGRGLVRFDRVYEFQTAYCMEGDVSEKLREFCGSLPAGSGIRAKRIPVLPDIVNPQALAGELRDIQHIPVGVSKEKLHILSISLLKTYVYTVTSQERGLAINTAAAIGSLINRLDDVLVEVWDPENSYSSGEGDNLNVIKQGFEQVVCALFDEIVMRNNTYKDAGMDTSVLEQYQRRVVVIGGLERLFSILSFDGKDKLRVFLEKGESDYRVHFIIADDARSLGSFKAEGWYRKSVDQTNGIWVSDGFADQYLINVSKHSSAFYQEIGPKFGYVVSKGKPILAKIVTTAEEDEENG
jgi:S-DNA-T family DNA segregation ATPase FtsK/SpoIIIE